MRFIYLPACVALLLAACDGGGGGGASGPGSFTVTASVNGLTGTVGLENNGTSTTAVSANGTATFTTTLVNGAPYDVTVATQPAGQTCTVTNGSGTISSSNVINVSVNCTNNTYAVGGTISGLIGTATLQLNGANNRTFTGSGSFSYAGLVAHGSGYAVTVATQPTGQTCTVSNGSGTINAADVTNVSVTCATNTYSVGYTVTGLVGTLILSNNGTNNSSVSANGNYVFSAAVAHGGAYSVTVATPPAGQSCSITNGSGTIAAANVSNVAVTCAPRFYTIGGTVSGLSGSVTLRNNGGNDLALGGSGSFVFSNTLIHGGSYNITVATQPTGQTCAVSNGSGIATTNVTNISVTCTTNTYSIGFSVSGLNGTLVLSNNGGNNASITINGNFGFTSRITHGGTYNVTVATQPTGQTCTVGNGSGTATANVTTIAVTCTTNTYSIGFSVSGLKGTLVLSNNGGNNASVTTNGNYTFTNRIAYGGTYSVAVVTHPISQSCLVASGVGTATANITNISIACGVPIIPAAPAVTITASAPKTLSFSWVPVSGADYYKLSKNPDATSGYTQIGSSQTSTTATESIAVHLTDWINASYFVEACNVVGCTASDVIYPTSAMINAIGYFKASNTVVANEFGNTVAMSADGNTLAVSGRNSVYLFFRAGNTWQQQANIIDPNFTPTYASQSFGRAISLSADGNLLAVGAGGENSDATGDYASHAGAVYVFSRSKSNWYQQAYIKASNAESNDFFGGYIALSADGSTLAVSAMNEASGATDIDGNQADNSAPHAGAIYVFIRSGNSWNQQAYIKALNAAADDFFGWAIALSADGNTLAVGARLEDSNASGIGGNQFDNSAANAGAVYVYVRSSNTWNTQAYIKASNATASDYFGTAIALSSDGNTLAVGSTGSGATSVFLRSGGTWSQQAYIKASNTTRNDSFGVAVALSADGNMLAVGAYSDASDASGVGADQQNTLYRAPGAGAVYVFSRSSSTWSQRVYVKASNAEESDIFGASVSMSANATTLAVGAPSEASGATGIDGNQEDNSAPRAGAVYLY